MNMGIFLQYLGIAIAVTGFIIAGKAGYSELQVLVLLVGIIISAIGFLQHLRTPVRKQKNKRVPPQYITKSEKNWAFLKAALCYALFIVMPWYFNSDDSDLSAEYPQLFLIPLLVYTLLLIREARTIYRK